MQPITQNRPGNTVIVTASIPRDLVEALRAEAEEQDVTVSTWMRHAIRAHLRADVK